MFKIGSKLHYDAEIESMCWTHIPTQTHTQRVCYTLQSNTDREPVCFPSVSLFQSTELFPVVSAGGISLTLNWFVTVPLPFWSPWHKNTNVFLQQNFFLVIFGQVCIETVGSFCNKHNLIRSFWILLQSYSSISWIQFKIQCFFNWSWRNMKSNVPCPVLLQYLSFSGTCEVCFSPHQRL